jgi:pimeloyl-ACP methyl ester carboxylesterase
MAGIRIKQMKLDDFIQMGQKLPLLRGVHRVAHRLLLARGYRWELRRSGDLQLGLWRKEWSVRDKKLVVPARLVVIPGFGDSPLLWLMLFSFLQPLLKSRYQEIVLVDYPGFGGFLSDKRGFHSIDQMMDGIADVFDTLKPDTIVGHSLGGYVAAYYAALCGAGERPKTNRKLYEGPAQIVLLDPSGVYEDVADKDALLGRFQSAVDEGFHHLRPHVFSREPAWFPLVRHAFDDFVRREDIGHFIRSIRDDHELSERLSHVKAQVHLLWGENDTLIPFRLAKVWMKAFPEGRSRSYIIRGAGHSPHVEKPGVTAMMMAQILTGRRPSPLGSKWWRAI